MARDKASKARSTTARVRVQSGRPLESTLDLTDTVLSAVGAAWPVGSIFCSAVATNPATLLGVGTWVQIAAGRVLVGIDPTQAEFDTLGETGGEKTHLLTAAEVP